MVKMKGFGALLRMTAVLTLVCTLTALLLSVVYAATNEMYEKNLLAEKQKAIAALFDREAVQTQTLTANGLDVTEVYRVTEYGVTLGYCANVKSAGFGGDMDMMVAIEPQGTLLGVRIVAMSETPGLGSRAAEQSHLSQYRGLGPMASVVLEEDVDAISGATISSRAVNEGVNRALEVLMSYVTGGNAE